MTAVMMLVAIPEMEKLNLEMEIALLCLNGNEDACSTYAIGIYIGRSWKGRVLIADVVLSILSDNCVAGSLPTWRTRGSSIVVGIQNECLGNKEMEYYCCCIAQCTSTRRSGLFQTCRLVLKKFLATFFLHNNQGHHHSEL
jgi:hypothetical protein